VISPSGTCDQHGQYTAIVSTWEVGDKTFTSKSLCPACDEIQRSKNKPSSGGDTDTPTTLVCERHGEYAGRVRTLRGLEHQFVSPCPACELERKQAREEEDRKFNQELRESMRREAMVRNRAAARIPERFARCGFEQYHATTNKQKQALSATKAYADHFATALAGGHCLTLCGRPGTGKTHLACAIANRVLDVGKKVIYTQAIEIVRDIRNTWRRDSEETETEVIQRFRKVDLLILDEVGVQFQSEAERVHLFDVLDGRYRDRKPTVLVSNLDGKGIQECLGSRLFDRLTEIGSAVITFEWESHRGKPMAATATQTEVMK
jgi:DNA replication protein DnaC